MLLIKHEKRSNRLWRSSKYENFSKTYTISLKTSSRGVLIASKGWVKWKENNYVRSIKKFKKKA